MKSATGAAFLGYYVGIVTAAVAWYTSAAGVVNGMRGGAPALPVGKPLWAARLSA